MEFKRIAIVFASNGKQLTIGSNTSYGITHIEGLESSDITISMVPTAQYDGSTVNKVRIEPRPITIEAEYPALPNTEEVRHWLESFFMPKNKGTLSVDYCGTKRKIEYYCSRFKDNRINLFSPLAFSITLTCPDPWFYDAEKNTADMVKTVPLLTFPFNSLQGIGITSGTSWRSTEIEINNTGDDAIGLVVEITANGTIKDPYIESGTQRVQAKCTMVTNDIIVFSTVPLKKDIILNGKGNTPYYRKSDFFSIPPGKSILRIGAASGISNATASAHYSFKYMGV